MYIASICIFLLKMFFRNSVQTHPILSPWATHSQADAAPRGTRALLHRCEKPRLPGGSRQISRSKTGARQEVRLYLTRHR